MIISNRVDKETLREVQLDTLRFLKDILKESFGPMGSTTLIKKINALNTYSKDGHTILKNIDLKGDIETSIKEDMEELTKRTVLDLGDSTTSIVLLSAILFESLSIYEKNHPEIPPMDLNKHFKTAVKFIQTEIERHGRPATVSDIYNVSLICTNNDADLSARLAALYKEHGMNVFIDVTTSTDTETYIKEYDGLTLEAGYSETAFINNTKDGRCDIKNARIYAFTDPIDTVEMVKLFDTIVADNIIGPYNKLANGEEAKVIPTVVLAPMISKDLSAYMTRLTEWFLNIEDANSKPPFCIVTNIYDHDLYYDLATLCGCTRIHKYIDPTLQKVAEGNGEAPTPETIHNFCGGADLVSIDLQKTMFVNPKKMKDENGELSHTFNSILAFLNAELKKAKEEGEDFNVTGNLKRRINSLKANMVEIAIGGMTVADRDERRHLMEDAVLNCRSTAKYGVGYGANYEGLVSSETVLDDVALIGDGYVTDMVRIIRDAYIELSELLYSTVFGEEKAKELVRESIGKGPMNLRRKEFDKTVLSSIKTDSVVLENISKLLTLMLTTNQALLPGYLGNSYLKIK